MTFECSLRIYIFSIEQSLWFSLDVQLQNFVSSNKNEQNCIDNNIFLCLLLGWWKPSFPPDMCPLHKMRWSLRWRRGNVPSRWRHLASALRSRPHGKRPNFEWNWRPKRPLYRHWCVRSWIRQNEQFWCQWDASECLVLVLVFFVAASCVLFFFQIYFNFFSLFLCLHAVLQFSMRSRTPSLNGSLYSPTSMSRKVGVFYFLFIYFCCCYSSVVVFVFNFCVHTC